MTRSRTVTALAAATIGLALACAPAAPAAFADDMSHPGTTSTSDNMGKTKDSGMKKDTMSHGTMANDGMKKNEMTK